MLQVFSSGRGSWELRVWPTGKVWQALPEQEWQPDKVEHRVGLLEASILAGNLERLDVGLGP